MAESPRNVMRTGTAVALLGFFGLVLGCGSPWMSALALVMGVGIVANAAARQRSLPPAPPAPPPAPRARPEPPAPAAAPAPPAAEPIPFEVLRARHARPAVALIRPYPPHRAPVGRSRFGGLPDLPAGTPWPRSFAPEQKAELPLHFLAQVDLAELPWRPDGVPSAGTLLFFARVDETMTWDHDPVRVLYDAASAGAPTPPPEDIRPIEDGHNDFDRTFSPAGAARMTVYPAWPLVPVRIETMPDPEAFVPNAWHDPRYRGYHAALMQFRADEAERASGRPAAGRERGSFPIYAVRDRHRIEIDAASGFPWAARGIGLVTAAMGVFPAVAADLQRWSALAEALSPSEPVVGEDALAFVDALNRALAAADAGQRGAMAHRLDAAMRRLVTETGGDRALAALLPDALYAVAAREHAPIHRSGSGKEGGPWTSDDHQRVQLHQMFGWVPASQSPLSVESAQRVLLQLQSDDGIDLKLCDLGEADFLLEAADLAAFRLDRVIGQTAGG